MQPVTPTSRWYDPTTIAFHWLTAFLVAEQWLGAQTIDWFPSGTPRIDARSVTSLWESCSHRSWPPASSGA